MMWVYIGIALSLVIIVGFAWLLQPYLSWKKNFTRQKAEFITILTQSGGRLTRQQFLDSKKSINYQFSLVVPAYNEESRLPIMLDQAVEHMRKLKVDYEIIIVNDGSKDKTTEIALQKGKDLKVTLVVVEYPKNRGKGGAIRCGLSVATGIYQLMVDADGATTFSELDKITEKMYQLEKELKHPLIMVVGSRHHLTENSKVERKLIRKFISWVFKQLISVICGIKTKDTQCGFKLFTRESAKMLFKTLHLERWAFDIELFLISNKFKCVTAQIPVEWRDIDGSKLNMVQASIEMFRDIVLIRVLYILRLWKFTDRVIIQ